MEETNKKQIIKKFKAIFDLETKNQRELFEKYYLDNFTKRELGKLEHISKYSVFTELSAKKQIPIILSEIFAGTFDDCDKKSVVELFENLFNKIGYTNLKLFTSYKKIPNYFREIVLEKGFMPSEFTILIGFSILPSNKIVNTFIQGIENDLVISYNTTFQRWIDLNVVDKKINNDIFFRNHIYIKNKILPFVLEITRESRNVRIINILSRGYMFRIMNHKSKYKSYIKASNLEGMLFKSYSHTCLEEYDDEFIEKVSKKIVKNVKSERLFADVIHQKLIDRNSNGSNVKKYKGVLHRKIFRDSYKQKKEEFIV